MGLGNKVIGNTFILGVTGVIGSGKSTLCKFFEEKYGFHWIHADAITHELYKPDQAGYRKIKEYFGSQFVGKRGVHRGRLRRFILKSPQKLWILNQLIHPLIIHEVNKKIVQLLKVQKEKERPSGAVLSSRAEARPMVKISIEAVYFEPKDLGKFIDELVTVHCPDDTILFKRLAARKVPRQQLQTLISFQRKNLPKFGMKIENTGSKRDFYEKMAMLAPRLPFLGSFDQNEPS